MNDLPTEPNEPDDAALLRRYLTGGQSAALGELFQRHAKVAYRVALRVVRNPADAEDAVQAAFVQVLRKAHLFRGEADGVKPWLMAIVVNACRQKIRKSVRRTHREEMFSADIPETTQAEGAATDERDERLALVKKALDRLPEKYRVALWLHHYEGLPFREVADILSVRESAVRTRASRGMEALRRLLTRSGLTVPALTLGRMIPQLPSESPPDSLLASLNGLAEKAGGARLFRRSPGWKKPVLVGAASVAVTAGAIGYLVLIPEQNWEMKRESGGHASGNSRIERVWDFNKPGQTEGLNVTRGTWRHVEDQGPDGSGCKEVLNIPLRVELDVPLFPATWKLTYRTRSLRLDKPQKFKNFSLWDPVNKLGIISGVGRLTMIHPDAVAGPWETVHIFISDEWIGQWKDDGRPMNLFFTKRLPNARLNLIVEGYYYLDDLTLQSIGPDELPDIRPFTEALEAIPEEKRVGTVPLPQIKSDIPGEQVKIHFQAGGPL